MRLNWLSNKGSLAPYIYLLLHIFIVTGFIFTSPNIIDLSNYKYTILFWVDAVVTLVLFFVVHNTDPGYVPYDGVFFTDQEEAPHSASANLKYDSMMKLKAADSRIMYPGFDLSPSALDNEGKKKMLFGQKSPGDDKSQFLKMTIGSTAVSKNMKDTLSSPNLEKMRREEEECDTQRQEENPGDMDQTRVDVDLSQEDTTQRHEEMEYQASDNREGENTQAAYQVHSGFNDMSHIEESPKANREMSNFNEGKRFHEEKETKKPGHMDQYRVKYGLQLDDVEEEDHTYQTNNSPVKSKGNGDVKTDNGEVPRHQPYQNQSSTENTKEKNQEGSHDDSNSRKETLNHIEMVRTRNQLDVPDSKRFSNNVDVKDESFMSKDNQSQDPAGEAKPNQAVRDLENNKAEQKQLEALYVERRYCTACNLDQPLRSKHCRDCNRCVAQYDHHCPWIGTCIGEKNHLLFFFFLVFQLIELVWGEFKLIEGVIERSTEHEHWTSVDIWRIVVLIPATFFFILVGSLSIFHVYLATKNLTTWEFLSWSKISYLKEWQPNWGSPFSKGIRENVRFFLARHKELSRWKMPKYKAPLSQQTL